MVDMETIFRNYTDIQLNKDGFTIRFDSQAHAAEAYKDLTGMLKELDKAMSEKTQEKE